jgi:hypothetical protein
MALTECELELWEEAKSVALGRHVGGLRLHQIMHRALHVYGRGRAATYALASAPVSHRRLEAVVETLVAIVADVSMSAR